MPDYRIRVSKDYTVFAAAHFASYEGGQVEPLHGHNYRVAVSLEGTPNQDGFVYNFVPLKKIMRAVCDTLDHRLLLPTGNPLIEVRRDGVGYEVHCQGKRYVFPAADVVQLPISNTSVELLAAWLSEQVAARLPPHSLAGLRALAVEVEETFGQSAAYRRVLAEGRP